MMSKRYSSVTAVISIFLSFSILICISFLIHILAPVSFEEKWKEIKIPDGSTYTESLDILKYNGIIKSKLTFLLLGRITGSHTELKPGYYNLSASMSPLQVFDNIIRGSTVQYSITIPEGSNLKNIRKKLEGKGLIDDESWQLVYDREFIKSLNIDAPSLEGYLYPDTYYFAKGTPPETIFKVMVQRLWDNFNEPLRKRATALGLSINEVLTLASIVEKEAIYDFERPIISAVYHNRLKINMKLQADPTVLYGVEKRWKRIRYRDLRRVTPYNTYVIKGLPPGPIASPGIKSIKATLFYKDVDYMFFVAMNNGRHYFSRTGEEHMRAVVTYQRNGREFPGNAGKKED